MRDRFATVGPIAAVAVGVAFGLRCGLPVLQAMGVVGALLH